MLAMSSCNFILNYMLNETTHSLHEETTLVSFSTSEITRSLKREDKMSETTWVIP